VSHEGWRQDGRGCLHHDHGGGGSRRPAATRLRSTSTHGHPRIRWTQSAMPTAITKNSGSATAKPTAFASISAPAFPLWARSLTAHIPIMFPCLRSVRAWGAAGAPISAPRRSRIGSSGDCRAKASAGNTRVLKEWVTRAQKITHEGPPAWGLCGRGALGSGLTAGASLRKAALNAIRRQPYVQDCSQLRYF
jgi:hypothetical protein